MFDRTKDNPDFGTTRWSLIRQVSDLSPNDARPALEQLCETYWFPLYAYARRRGSSVSDAQDLTQSFFTSLLEREDICKANPDKGKFRTFLLTAFSNFLSNQHDARTALKRGGGKTILSIDWNEAESSFKPEPNHSETPERAFKREWALLVIKNSMAELQNDFRRQGKSEIFEHLSHFLVRDVSDEASYAKVARELQMNEAAVKTAVHRLRRKYRDLLRGLIADTVSTPDQIEDEINELFQALRG